jgi:hypothetical protein
MSRTEKYREQHRELEALIGQMAAGFDPARLAQDASPMRTLLSQLAGKVKVHLAMEDSALYPSMLKHPNPSVQAKAKAFMDEMGGIKQAFAAYLAKFPSAQAIQADPKGFIEATGAIAGALGKRIHAEDSDLYALVDRLD